MSDSKSGRPRILILADDVTVEGGVRTRVFDEISLIRSSAEIHLVSKVRFRNVSRIGRTREEIQKDFPSVGTTFVPFLPHHGFPVVREVLVGLNVLAMIIVGSSSALKSRPEVIYAHNLECAAAGLVMGSLFGVKVTGDFHGDEIEEDVSFNRRRRNGFRHRFWNRVLGAIVRRVDRLVCVSNSQKAHFERTFRRVGPTFVIPCCYSPAQGHQGAPEVHVDRPETPVLFYSGSPFVHQLVPEMAKMFSALLERRPESKFLLLISEGRWKSEVLSHFDGKARTAVEMHSVPHEQVPKYSARANIALLFRENTIFNNISSPTKFAEYLSSGLPVLITRGVGDYSALVEEEGLGKIIDLARIEEPEYVTTLVQEILDDDGIAVRCRRYAQEHLTWAAYGAIFWEAAFAIGDRTRPRANAWMPGEG